MEMGPQKNKKWLDSLSAIADAKGKENVQVYVTENLQLPIQECKGRVFWSPAKFKRWSRDIVLLETDKPTTSENLLFKVENKWELHEVHEDKTHSIHSLENHLLTLITYPFFGLNDSGSAQEAASVYVNEDGGVDSSTEPAWINGSTVIRRRMSDRQINFVPSGFKCIRYVPCEKRDEFLKCVAATPTCALTGATLMPNTKYASSLSKELAIKIGQRFGMMADSHGIRMMASASMRGHSELMSADHDFTSGFHSQIGCNAVHFKGSNLVALHGAAWEIDHGTSYLLEEETHDFSNHAKESALMATLTNPKSISFLANGGPTVAINLSRMLLLCQEGRVFALTGLHSDMGKSGASGAFNATEEQLELAIKGLVDLAPEFFGEKVPSNRADIIEALKQKPLSLLNWKGEFQESQYFLQPNNPNKDVLPGVTQDSLEEYASGCTDRVAAGLVK